MPTLTETVRTEIATVTPEMAKRLLVNNTNNRSVRENIVQRYARDMRSGNWSLNGEAVKIASDGTLLDGQHRLMGCVVAEVPFTTMIVRGLNFDVRTTMDTGARRTLGDVLRWRGEPNAAALAAAIEAALSWDELNVPSSHGAGHSNSERLAWLDVNPDISEAVKNCTSFVRTPFRVPLSSLAPFVFRAKRLSPTLAEEFLHLYKSGEGMDENHPIMRLRTFTFRAAASKGSLPREEWCAILVKAWNAYISGRSVRALSWRSSGAKAEPFPTMYGPDGRSYAEWAEDTLSAVI